MLEPYDLSERFHTLPQDTSSNKVSIVPTDLKFVLLTSIDFFQEMLKIGEISILFHVHLNNTCYIQHYNIAFVNLNADWLTAVFA